jgi:hypothetical protein
MKRLLDGGKLGQAAGRTAAFRRRGSLLVEAGAALMMLTVAMTLTVKVAGWVVREQRATDRRQQAISEAANLMERLTAVPFDELTTDSITTLTHAPRAGAAVPGSELSLGMVEDDPVGGAGSKKVSVKIRWRNRADEWDSPVLLTSWIYRSQAK